MQATIDDLKTMLRTVNLHNAAEQIEELLNVALNKSISYEKFLEGLMQCEINGREEKRFERRLKHASFPEYKTLDEFCIFRTHTDTVFENIRTVISELSGH